MVLETCFMCRTSTVLTFEALGCNAQVGERTKTAEELAAEEEQRLQRLEAQRLKRLRGSSGDNLGEVGSASEEDDLTGLGGFAARRAKRMKREAAGKSYGACTAGNRVTHTLRKCTWNRMQSRVDDKCQRRPAVMSSVYCRNTLK